MPRRRDVQLLRSLGARLQEIRKDAGWTQEELAEAIDVEAVTVSRYETGSRALSLTLLARVAQALDVTLSELLDIELEMPKPKRMKGEAKLLNTWRSLQEEDRGLAIRLVREVARGK